jgi:hypothetical protein
VSWSQDPSPQPVPLPTNATVPMALGSSDIGLGAALPRPFAVEQWTITNKGGLVPPGPHPPHRRQDHCPKHQRRQAVRLGGWPQGRLLCRRERVDTALIQFDTQPDGEGRFMIHCDNVSHEDHDMTVQFSAGDKRANDPRGPDTTSPRCWSTTLVHGQIGQTCGPGGGHRT